MLTSARVDDRMRALRWALIAGVVATACQEPRLAVADQTEALSWTRLADLPDPPGVAGAFAGVSAGSLIVAGGANFPDKPPWEGGTKRWYDAVWVLDAPRGSWRRLAGRLPRPLGYGIAATWGDGIVCAGGSSADGHHADAFVLRVAGERLVVEPLPSLPLPLANACGHLHGARLYVVGGSRAPDATEAEARAWTLDLEARDAGWLALPPLPAPGRMLACCGVQARHLVVAGGTALRPAADGSPERVPLTDTVSLAIDRPGAAWRRVAHPPRPIIAAPSPAIALGSAELLFLGGDDGVRPAGGPAAHAGFRRDVLAYDVLTDTWSSRGTVPEATVTTAVVSWQGGFVVPGGEIRPGVRTTAVWSCRSR